MFYRPSKEFFDNYINELQGVVIVRALVSETPLQLMKNVPTATIEKILVDALVDEESEFLRGNEINHVFIIAFDRNSINIRQYFRYRYKFITLRQF